MVTCYIALGSNLGNRQQNINLALKYLKEDSAIKILKTSSLIETNPVGGPSQPKFFNGVSKLETNYTVRQLLEKLQEIEVKLGRKIPRTKNQPRTIDLDILTYGDLKIDEQGLKIPHPRMWEREFVTVPLKEIAPELFKYGSRNPCVALYPKASGLLGASSARKKSHQNDATNAIGNLNSS